MDREIWQVVLQAVKRAARSVKGDRRRPVYPEWLIVAMYLWSVWHDRCLSWACDRAHYGGVFRPRGALPSISQFTRRVKTDRFQQVLQATHQQLLGCGLASFSSYFDGKALVVGPFSKDREVGVSKVGGAFAKGYKLHACVNEHRRVRVWSVMPLNVAEQSVALELCDYLPPAASSVEPELMLADSNYDSAPLHKKLAQSDRLLLTPLKGQQRVDPVRGHHPVTLRQMGEQRREAVTTWREHPTLARIALRDRITIERTFSVLTVAMGLHALPPWVRTLARVTRWVGAKILLYHARLQAQERAGPLQN